MTEGDEVDVDVFWVDANDYDDVDDESSNYAYYFIVGYVETEDMLAS